MSQANALTSTEGTPDIKIDLTSRDDDPTSATLTRYSNEILELPANPRRPRERPDLEDVVTQQTELLAAMLRRLNQQPAPAAESKSQLPTRPFSGTD